MTWSRAAAGFDTLDFSGGNIGETITISANGSGAVQPSATATSDLNGVERIEFEAQGQSADNITINDLTGTDVKQVAIDLGGGAGDGDGQADTVSHQRAANGQAITVTDNNGVITVSGLASTVTISNFEEGTDQLFINGQTVTQSHRGEQHNTGGTSTASDRLAPASLALLGQHMASSFVTGGRWSRYDADRRSAVETSSRC